MKKNYRLFFVLLLVFVLLTFSACGLGDVTKDARAVVEEFYDAFSDEDYDDIVDLLHEDIVADFGGDNATEENFEIVRNALGDVDDYKITSFDTEKAGGDALVKFVVDTEYENGYESEDTFEVYFYDDNIVISSFELPAYAQAEQDILDALKSQTKQSTDGSYMVTKEDVVAYVDDYYYMYSQFEIDTILDFMHPELIDSLGGNDEAWAFFSSIRTVHGDILDYSIASYEIEPVEGGTYTAISINTDYANGDDTLDTFEVYTDADGYALFAFADFPTAGLVENLTDAYLTALENQDLDMLYRLFSVSTQGFLTKADSDAYYTDMFDTFGQPLEILTEEYLPHIYEEFDDGTVAIFYLYYEFDCALSPMLLEMYYSVEDGVIGVLDVNYDYMQ